MGVGRGLGFGLGWGPSSPLSSPQFPILSSFSRRLRLVEINFADCSTTQASVSNNTPSSDHLCHKDEILETETGRAGWLVLHVSHHVEL